ncbi:MAG: hypothetical protein RIQ93_1579, partial [Verrucomicrobiota bacterium]
MNPIASLPCFGANSFPAPARPLRAGLFLAVFVGVFSPHAVAAAAAQFWAGAAKVDITHRDAPLANEPRFVKALVIGNETTRAVIVSIDVVAVAEIGAIRNDFVSNVRAQ